MLPLAILEKLKLTDKTRATMLRSPQTRARMKMLDAIETQIALAEAEQSGTPYEKRAMRYVTDPATGERVKKEVPIRVRSWSWKDADGQLMLDVRYGNRRVEIKPGKTAIQVGDAKNLVPILKMLADAARAGELDRSLQSRDRQPKE